MDGTTTPTTLYVGTDIGVIRSVDGGVTWSVRNEELRAFSVRAIAIDPHDASFVVIGGLTGVYRSTDSGRSWTQISDQINVESLAVDPRSHDRIYVGTWRQGTRHPCRCQPCRAMPATQRLRWRTA